MPLPVRMIVQYSLERFGGVHAEMALALERGKPIPRATLQLWARRLREAADEIEKGLT